jgi:hypothetical protein
MLLPGVVPGFLDCALASQARKQALGLLAFMSSAGLTLAIAIPPPASCPL